MKHFDKSLDRAIESGNVEKARRLLGAGADLEMATCAGEVALFGAAALGDVDMVRLLLEHGAPLTINRNRTRGAHKRNNISSAKDYAGSPEVKRLLMNSEALHAAMQHGDIERFRALIAEGGCVNAIESEHGASLTHKISRADFVEALTSAGADWSKTHKERSVVHSAVHPELTSGKDVPGIVRAMARMGLNMNARGGNNVTPLLLALGSSEANGWYGREEVEASTLPGIVEALIESGADVNAESGDGRSALVLAAMHNAVCCRPLLAAGANVNHADSDGRTPLMEAAWRQDEECVHLLLDSGADLDARDHGGQTARDHSAQDIEATAMENPRSKIVQPNVIDKAIAVRERARLLAAAQRTASFAATGPDADQTPTRRMRL
ncbi:ankyrin repeat domain-containing protein [Pseudomarimonas arenosa]|uniref:Ankyrin repeat domain-containing protein n=1 Tax=Pseudomarimonas arenosa TaxID=2774145 RepID=A0AAW3ZHZ3_9GAMM|nr:ankyrin repeat domain-containing protein [Pseudomarimonas arenosa]MBD8524126.1 ankyrin repeat domain-containing protein [Pseudomarimonas arenosa]